MTIWLTKSTPGGTGQFSLGGPRLPGTGSCITEKLAYGLEPAWISPTTPGGTSTSDCTFEPGCGKGNSNNPTGAGGVGPSVFGGGCVGSNAISCRPCSMYREPLSERSATRCRIKGTTLTFLVRSEHLANATASRQHTTINLQLALERIAPVSDDVALHDVAQDHFLPDRLMLGDCDPGLANCRILSSSPNGTVKAAMQSQTETAVHDNPVLNTPGPLPAPNQTITLSGLTIDFLVRFVLFLVHSVRSELGAIGAFRTKTGFANIRGFISGHSHVGLCF